MNLNTLADELEDIPARPRYRARLAAAARYLRVLAQERDELPPDPEISALKLTAMEERLLGALRVGCIVGKEKLYQSMYFDRRDADVPELNTLDVFLCKLRKKIKGTRFSIVAIHGRGLMLQKAAVA
jgi:DNA-binding response OmpR family regulator